MPDVVYAIIKVNNNSLELGVDIVQVFSDVDAAAKSTANLMDVYRNEPDLEFFLYQYEINNTVLTELPKPKFLEGKPLSEVGENA